MNTPEQKPLLANRRKQVETAVQKRLLAHIAGGRSTDLAAKPLHLPAEIYTDPQRLEAERRELFLKLPLVAGFSADIPNPGDIKVFDGAGPSIIVMRNSEGKVNAFRNMCTHRASRLVEKSDNRATITCPFHGWSFNHDGQLVGQPGKAGFEGMDKQRMNLLRVPSAERHGMIFVKAGVSTGDGDSEIDIDAFLGSLGPDLEQLDFGAMALIRAGRLPANGNWKYVLDTFGEGYHFAALHPDTLGTTHYNNVAAYDALGSPDGSSGPHWRVSFGTKAMNELTKLPEAEWPGLNPIVYYIFPNTAIVVGSPQPGLDVVQLFNIFPDGVTTAHVDLELYAPLAAVNDATRPMLEAGYDLAARIVQTEDFSIAAAACANLRWAPPGFGPTLGRNEIALQDMERNIAKAAGMPLEE